MYQKKSPGWIKHLDFIIGDAICILIAFFIANYIRFSDFTHLHNTYYRYTAFVLVAGHFFVSLLYENYKNILKRGYLLELKGVLYQLIGTFFALFIYYYFTKTGDKVSRIFIFLSFAVSVLLVYLFHLIWKYALLNYYSKNRYQDRQILLVTSNEDVEEMVTQINQKNIGDTNIVGIVLPDETKYKIQDKIQGIPVLFTTDTMIDDIQTLPIDEVLIYLPSQPELNESLIDDCTLMGLTVHQRINVGSDRPTKKAIERTFGYTTITEGVQIASTKQVIIKRLMDIAGAIIGLIITAILTVVIGPIIFLCDPGPIFFSQLRVGQNGRVFKIYKFRSMYQDAEKRKQELLNQNEMNGYMFKMENDPRIIKGIGWFIRKTSIDEFPQFWNVLLGQMSLVGTRPPTLDEWEHYEKHHRARLALKPGITGLWQVSGRSEITDFEEVVRLDMEYINNWSVIEDIKILARTIPAVFKRDGAK